MAEKDDTPAFAKELEQGRQKAIDDLDKKRIEFLRGLNPEAEHPMEIKDSPLKPKKGKENDGPLTNLPSPLKIQKGGTQR